MHRVFSPSFAHDRYSHAQVRDLCWVLAPENDLLMRLAPHERFVPVTAPHAVATWLSELDKNPAALVAAVAGPRRLGIYFERLLLFYLRYGPHDHGELIDHNLALYAPSGQHRVTVGELDFLLKQGETRCHLEVAVKFYLGVDLKGAPTWLGPDWQDRFDRKLSHLRNHQLPLSSSLERDNEAPFRRQFLVKGILFHPWPNLLPLSSDWGAAAQPAWWLSLTDLGLFPCNEEDVWWWLPKPRWLGGNSLDAAVTALPWQLLPDILQRHFAESQRVVMLRRARDGQRLLITPADWLAGAVATLK